MSTERIKRLAQEGISIIQSGENELESFSKLLTIFDKIEKEAEVTRLEHRSREYNAT